MATATFNSILNAVKTSLTTAFGSSPVVYRRKRIRKRKGDTLPLVLVVGVRSVPEDYDSEGYTYKRYEVQVVVLYAGNQIQESGFSLVDTMELAEKTLNTSALSGVGVVYDTDVIENPLYDSSLLDEDIEEGVMQINYFTYELKN